ncbi:MAG: hypothetical protein IPI67_09135 [Myxococcales bacterium]|nr:hypothetical protein [Myxococcales bacterium]
MSIACSALLGAGGVVGAAPEARAQTPDCVEFHEQAVAQRKAGALVHAQASFAACTAPACPGPVREECAAETRRLNGLIPTLVLAARTADGRELSRVQVLADGRPFVDTLDGRAVRLDPGAHTLRFEASGLPPVEARVLLAEGDRLRKVAVVLGSGSNPSESKAIPTLSWVFAGVGVVGLVGFGYFGLSGLSQESDLKREGCEPNCSRDKTDRLKRSFLLADISLAIGAVGLGAATWVFVSSRRAEPSARASNRVTTLGLGATF